MNQTFTKKHKMNQTYRTSENGSAVQENEVEPYVQKKENDPDVQKIEPDFQKK